LENGEWNYHVKHRFQEFKRRFTNVHKTLAHGVAQFKQTVSNWGKPGCINVKFQNGGLGIFGIRKIRLFEMYDSKISFQLIIESGVFPAANTNSPELCSRYRKHFDLQRHLITFVVANLCLQFFSSVHRSVKDGI
jgi:hypothetical protein